MEAHFWGGDAIMLLGTGDQTRISAGTCSSSDAEKVVHSTITSLSKPVSAMLAMKLVQLGYLSLDEPLSTYLSWWGTGGPAGEITLRHLLSQTSGFVTNWMPCFGLDDRARCAQRIHGTYPQQAGSDGSGTPGRKYHYSESNWVVVGALAEAATGQSWDDLFQRLILSPLSVPASECSFRDSLLAPAIDPGASLACSPAAFATIWGAYYAGRVVGAQGMAEMEAPQTKLLGATGQEGGLTIPQDNEWETLGLKVYDAQYGLGLMQFCLDKDCAGGRVQWHGGATGWNAVFSRDAGWWGVLSRFVPISDGLARIDSTSNYLVGLMKNIGLMKMEEQAPRCNSRCL